VPTCVNQHAFIKIDSIDSFPIFKMTLVYDKSERKVTILIDTVEPRYFD